VTFAAPWALWGLVLLVGPVLVHLLSRRQARRTPFPSLQLLRAERLPPVSRRTLDDRGLLLLRLLVITAAVFALARPMPRAAAAATNAAPIRAIVLDTSVSMARTTTDGREAREVAERLADSLTLVSSRALRVRTVEPWLVLPASVAWLDAHGGGELVVVTDGEPDALAAPDVQAVSPALVVRVMQVSARPAAATGDAMLRVAFGRPREASALDAPIATVRRVAPPFVVVSDSARDRPHLIVREVRDERAQATAASAADAIDVGMLRVMARVQHDTWLQDRLARQATPAGKFAAGVGDAVDVGTAIPRRTAPDRESSDVRTPDTVAPDASFRDGATSAPFRVPITGASRENGLPVGWLSPTQPLTLWLRSSLESPESLALLAATIDALHAELVLPLREATHAATGADWLSDSIAAARTDANIAAWVRAADTSQRQRAGGVLDDGPSPLSRGLWLLALVMLTVEWAWRTRLARVEPVTGR
jgi:hypothetical protein